MEIRSYLSKFAKGLINVKPLLCITCNVMRMVVIK